MNALELNKVHIKRGDIPIVYGVDIVAKPGEISVLLGANGAGKTTILEGTSGVIPIASGDIVLEGTQMCKASAGHRARSGIAHVEQGRTIFAEMSTEDNLRVGLHPESGLEQAYDLFPELKSRANVKSAMLSGGEQQMLVIARALLGKPKVVLIDEMSAGLAPVVVARLMQAVRLLADQGLAVLLVEQFANLALDIGDRAYVLRRGEVVYDGSCEILRNDPAMLHHLYLGDMEKDCA